MLIDGECHLFFFINIIHTYDNNIQANIWAPLFEVFQDSRLQNHNYMDPVLEFIND